MDTDAIRLYVSEAPFSGENFTAFIGTSLSIGIAVPTLMRTRAVVQVDDGHMRRPEEKLGLLQIQTVSKFFVYSSPTAFPNAAGLPLIGTHLSLYGSTGGT